MTWLAHMTSLFDLVSWITHALHHHGIVSVQTDMDKATHRAWIETPHWIITIRGRG